MRIRATYVRLSRSPTPVTRIIAAARGRDAFTYPFQLLEVLPQEGDRVLGPAHAQLHYTVFQDLLDIVSLHVFLALA